MVTIENFCVEKHLAYVMQSGLNTQEFATGDKIIFWSEDALKNWAKKNDGSMLVAVNRDLEVVGYLLAIFNNGKIATLENIHVRDGFRKQGIASKLLKEFESRAVKAGIAILRSFCHTTNAAMARLLAKHHYSEGILTQWYVNQPKAANRESEQTELQVRKLDASDVGAETYAHFSNALVSDLIYQGAPSLESAQIIYGAFINGLLVGLVSASADKPVDKATIERIFVDCSKGTPRIIKSLILSLMHYLAVQNISCVTIHPFVESSMSLDLITILDALDFKKRRVFVMNLKSV